jgi:hypothetical protein
MKHLAVIHTDFLKEARSYYRKDWIWDDLALDKQHSYLKRHPKSKRKLTAGPKKGKNTKSSALTEGQKVRLKPNKSEGFTEEFGIIDSIDKSVVTVTVDKKYRDGPEDDGLREVTLDQIEVQSGKESAEDIDAQIAKLQKKKQELADKSSQSEIKSAPKPKKSKTQDFFEDMITNIWKDEDVEKQQKILERHFPKSKKLIDKIINVAGEASNTRSEAEDTREDREHQQLERAFSRNFEKMEKLINKLFSK